MRTLILGTDWVRPTALVGLAWACTACGGGGLGQPVNQFPSKAELEHAVVPDAAPALKLKTVEVDQWSIETPAAAPEAKYPVETAWDRLLIELVQGKHHASAPLRCAATESARFFVEHHAYPGDGLRRYLIGRCGATLPSAGFSVVDLEVSDETPEERIESELRQSVTDMLAQVSAPKAEVGLGYARGNGRAAFVMYYGSASGTLDAFPAVVSGDGVTLAGSVPQDVEVALGLVTEGQYDVRFCEPDRRVRAPRFRITCKVAQDDPIARVEIVTRRPGQVLMESMRSVLVRRSEDAGLVYQPELYGAAETVSGADEFRGALVRALNAVRETAGQRPFKLEGRQSISNERLIPTFFDAMLKSSSDQIDWLALGLLAGWDVQGMIRDGGIYWGMVATSRSPGRWLNYAFESPLGRWVLLEPSMSHIALGAAPFDKTGVMAIATTYAFFEQRDHSLDEDAVFDELVKVRRALGLMPPKRVRREAALETALASVAGNSQTTGEALNQAIYRIGSQQNRPISGWVVETNDLKHLPFDDALLGTSLEVEVGITHYRAPGGAWGQYVVAFVLYQGGAPAGRYTAGNRVRVIDRTAAFGFSTPGAGIERARF